MKTLGASWFYLLFLIFALSSALWALRPSKTLLSVLSLIELFGLYFSVSVFPLTGNDYVFVSKAVILGGFVAASFGLILYFSGITYPYSPRCTLVINNSKWVDPNHFAASMIIPFMLSLEQTVKKKTAVEKAVFLIIVVVIGAALFLTGSRGVLLGVFVALTFLLFRTKPKITLRGIIIISVFSLLAIFILSMFPNSPQLISRFSLKTILLSGGAGRFAIWKAGWKAFLHRPIFGYGYANFPYAYNLFRRFFRGYYFSMTARPAHNIYLQIFTETGIIGGMLFLYAMYKYWRFLKHLEKRNAHAITLESAFLALMVTGVTLGILSYKYFWLVFDLIAILYNTKRLGGKFERI